MAYPATTSSICSVEQIDVRIQGVGVGLREKHITHILQNQPDVPWFELLADNHLAEGGLIPKQLDAISERYPLTLHCVGMSIGGTDPLDLEYLGKIKHLKERSNAQWISDHLAFTQFQQRHFHDLLPVPYTEEALKHIAQRMAEIQDFFGETMLIENPSSYFNYADADFSEADFMVELVETSQCKLLLDINNVYVSAVNHSFSAEEWLVKIPVKQVQEIHLAGHEQRDGYLLDSHSTHVTDEVWLLYQQFMSRVQSEGAMIPTLIEWDNQIPAFDVLHNEAKKAESLGHLY